MSILNLTPSQLRQAADLQEQIAALETELTGLLEGKAPATVQAPAKQSTPIKIGLGKRGKLVEGVTGKVLKKISDQQITDFISTGKVQGEVVKKFGQLIPKRLADMKKAGLVAVRRDGLKKIWAVV